ncbi:MAG: sulfite exporter TauE/SafE family protein [Rhodanobacteraceae bacterium]|nr:sulfite exporter TauE/SafE family protein [Rhodanobacteraceae bacterium]
MPIDLLVLGAAFLSGLLGSLHCVAMCGGIATGLGAAAGGSRTSLSAAIWISLGRLLGYTVAGALAGAVGAGLLNIARNNLLQGVLRSLIGLVIILLALRLLDSGRRLALLHRTGRGVWQWLAPLQRHLLPATTLPRRLALGMLWGWLPCGLSSTLLLLAWLQADVLAAALLMLSFGLGTLLLMLPLTWSGMHLGRRLAQPKLRRVAASLLLLSGLATALAPWLMHMPGVHALLAGLGCVG